MLDARDFDEWWDREERRSRGHAIGADYRHWAEAGFMAAAQLMTQALRTQKAIAQARDTQRKAALLQGPARAPSGYIRTLPQLHEANLPAAELAALLLRRARGKP